MWALLGWLAIGRKCKGYRLKCFGMLVVLLTLFGYPINIFSYVSGIDVVMEYNQVWFVYSIITTIVSSIIVDKKING